MYFMDDDNWLLPDALRNVWDAAQIPGDAVVLAGGMRVIDGTGKVRDEANFRPSRNSSARVLGGAYPLLGSYWVRNDAFFASGGFDRRFGGADDAHLPIRLALPGDFAHIPVPVAPPATGRHVDNLGRPWPRRGGESADPGCGPG